MIGISVPLIAHITRLSKTQNIVSIADFIGARLLGKHQAGGDRGDDRHQSA